MFTLIWFASHRTPVLDPWEWVRTTTCARRVVFNARYRSAAGSQTSHGHLVTLLHQAVGKVVDMTLHTPSARETKVADHQDAHARRGSYHQVAGVDSVRLRACNVCQLVYEEGVACCHCQSFSGLPRGREAAAVGSCRGCKGAFKNIQI